MSNPCFVAQIDLVLAEKLQEDLLSQGFEITKPPHTIFSANKKGVSCTLYLSGKLTVQGKDKSDFITFYLEPEILKTLTYSHPEIAINYASHIGIDEAGKGDFFGPLCIGGVQANKEQIDALFKLGVRDSKTMTDATVLKLSKKIKETCPHSVVKLFPHKYNELYKNFHNLNHLLAWGHATAIQELVEKTGCKEVIIDQFASEHYVIRALEKKKIEVSLTQRHRGEEDLVVAAASILARSAFLEGLEMLSQKIGFELPKGASAKVIQAGKALVGKHGEQILETVAKLHFKTREDILQG